MMKETLIERWFPTDTIGAESMRERGASSALPPLYFLHVWWARRPLLTSRAAILGSVLPAWNPKWPEPLRSKFSTEASYHDWFLKLCGILGDPVAGRRLIEWAKTNKVKLKSPPFAHKRAFTLSPSPESMQELGEVLKLATGSNQRTILDSFAGGGSIPFESLRYGFETFANELNPVASVILKATVRYPFLFGPGLANEIRKWGGILCDHVRNRLDAFFPVQPGESIHAYIWARTIACPYTGKPIPLSPNWWLVKGERPVALRLVYDEASPQVRFEVVQGDAVRQLDPDKGTVRRGNPVSGWASNQSVDGDYVKAEAQAGRMGQQLCAVAIKRSSGGFHFRPPTEADLKAVSAAERELAQRLPAWEAKGLVPREPYPPQSNDLRPIHYGMTTWGDFFSPRQLLALCTWLEEYRALIPRIRAEEPAEKADAILTYLAIPLDKAADYNSRLVRWHSGRQVIVNTFDRHDFSFKWSFAEFDGAHNLFPWVVEQVAAAYDGIARLAVGSGDEMEHRARLPVHLTQGNAASLEGIETGSIDHVCIDPPYEANVMYAECSDFFYVWMKRSLGSVFPDLFRDQLTNKDDEAVANEARFAGFGRKKKPMAQSDYERKMAACFREIHRVLSDDGVLTVMFTHKSVDAWDKLASSLIGAGFAIRSSWPVHTESEHSLHQAKKNAAQSTILLTCRKRAPGGEPVWWDELQGKVRQIAREKAKDFERQGIRGVDLYISTFGPTLALLSEQWPVLTSEMDEQGNPKPLRPEVALDLARTEVVMLRKRGLLAGRDVRFDPITDLYLLAWDAFRAREFPSDEARKLAMAVGLDLQRDLIHEQRVLRTAASRVALLEPKDRRRKGKVDPEMERFEVWLDALHTAMLLYSEDGQGACRRFLERTGLMKDPVLRDLIQSMLNAIPRIRQAGKFVLPEADVLEAMRLTFFPDLEVPVEEEPVVQMVQSSLDLEEDTAEEDESDEEDEGEE